MKRKVLVVDIGGSHVKLMTSHSRKLKFNSGAEMQPRHFIDSFRETVAHLTFDAVSVGFPAPVQGGEIVKNPKHLGLGWVRFNFTKALGRPTRVINDASMQALGSYVRGRTLFLGLGTGLGSALVWDHNVLPLELGDLPYRNRRKIEDFLGTDALEKLGKQGWRDEVRFVVKQLKLSLIADTVVLGGGNVRSMGRLPSGVKQGNNRNAFLGGCRLWETDPKTGKTRWNVV